MRSFQEDKEESHSRKAKHQAVNVLHWDQKGRRYRLKSGSGTYLVNGETKDHIVAEASAHFKLEVQTLVFQDGTEVPDDFDLLTYTRLTKLILSSTNSPHLLTLPEIWDILEPANISGNLPKKMAAVGSKRKRSILNYKDLNEISSVALYDTTRKGKEKFFEVDRLIEKRKVGHVSTTCHNKMIYLIFCYFLG